MEEHLNQNNQLLKNNNKKSKNDSISPKKDLRIKKSQFENVELDSSESSQEKRMNTSDSELYTNTEANIKRLKRHSLFLPNKKHLNLKNRSRITSQESSINNKIQSNRMNQNYMFKNDKKEKAKDSSNIQVTFKNEIGSFKNKISKNNAQRQSSTNNSNNQRISLKKETKESKLPLLLNRKKIKFKSPFIEFVPIESYKTYNAIMCVSDPIYGSMNNIQSDEKRKCCECSIF